MMLLLSNGRSASLAVHLVELVLNLPFCYAPKHLSAQLHLPRKPIFTFECSCSFCSFVAPDRRFMNMFGVGRRSHLDYWRRGNGIGGNDVWESERGASALQQILDVRAIWPLTISPQRKCCSRRIHPICTLPPFKLKKGS